MCPWLNWIEQWTPDPQVEGSNPFGHEFFMSKKICGLRIDVDTKKGFFYGLPRLLKLLNDLDINATFFITTGPDDFLISFKRIFTEKKFLKKIWLLKKSYLKLFYYKKISNEQIINSLRESNHEIAVHGYSHFKWVKDYDKWSYSQKKEFFSKSYKTFLSKFSITPKISAAPGWRISEDILVYQEKYNFKYASDIRGKLPFYPKLKTGEILKTLQIPVNLPTLDEIIVLKKIYPFKLKNFDVYCAHAELEGINYLKDFKNFLEINLKNNCTFLPLGKINFNFKIQSLNLTKKKMPGRTGYITEVLYE